MRSLRLGILLGPVAWLAVVGAVWGALQTYAGVGPGGIGVSLVAGTAVWASVGLLVSAWGRWRERAAIASGVSGVRPADGAHSVLVGTLEPTGRPLSAPLDGAPCVAYRYEIIDDRGRGRRRHIATVYRGTAITPSLIVTPTGSYRLLAVPDIEGREPSGTRDEMVARFQAYAATTTFLDRSQSAGELVTRWDDADGEYRSDVAYDTPAPGDTDHWMFVQRHVPPGSRVCVFGLFSESRGGIVAGAHPTRLIVGSPEQVMESLQSLVRVRAVLGVIAAIVAAGSVFLFLGA
ncbi:MAG: hypothetical protein R2712_15625 [Vicinamibacterales bacterium]